MAQFYSRLSFVCGVLLGGLIAVLFREHFEVKQFPKSRESRLKRDRYEQWFESQSFKRKSVTWDSLRYSNTSYRLESDLLKGKINVVCVILAKKEANVNASRDTWAQGCDDVKPIYLPNTSKPMPMKRRREQTSWFLLCNILTELKQKFDWVIVVNCNTFVIMENFRYFVAPLSSKKPFYLGHSVKLWNTAYNTAQAGYALNRKAVKMFRKHIDCSVGSYLNKEDFTLGKHLGVLNVTPIDTSDEDGFTTFYPYSWNHVLFPGESYYTNSVFPINCCSSKSIAFQTIDSSRMYTFHYLLYKLQIFSDGKYGTRPPPQMDSDNLVWRSFLKERGILTGNVTAQEYYRLWEELVNDPGSFAKNIKKEHFSDYD